MRYKALILDFDGTLFETSFLDGYYDELRKYPRNSAENKAIWKEIDGRLPEYGKYEGMDEVFGFIREHKIKAVLVTDAVKRRYEKAIKYYHVPISLYVGRFDVRKRKPNPEPMLKGLGLLDCEAKDVISIGNQIIDMDASHAAGIAFAACEWGMLPDEKEELRKRAEYILTTPSDIIKLITSSGMRKKSQEHNCENHTLIENIQTLMASRGYTQSSLARALGKQSVVINRALRGKDPISPKTQMEIAEHFGVTVEELNGSITLPAAKNIQGFIKFNNERTRDISSIKDLKAVYKDIIYQLEERPKEVELLISECKGNEERVKTKPHNWSDIDLFSHEEYNPKNVYCWTFRKANDERDNIVNSLGNMCPGYPFIINGHKFYGSEQAYIAGLFSGNTDNCINIQKALMEEQNGYAAKKTIRNRNERKYGRRDWEEFNVQWMLYVVWQKCKGNKAFSSLLKKIPRNAIIIENSALQTGKTSDFWGCRNDEWKNALKVIASNAEIVCSGKSASVIQDRIIKDSNAITCIGIYKGVNCMGKILTICRDCLLDKTEPQIDYELLRSKQIYLLGELIKFDK